MAVHDAQADAVVRMAAEMYQYALDDLGTRRRDFNSTGMREDYMNVTARDKRILENMKLEKQRTVLKDVVNDPKHKEGVMRWNSVKIDADAEAEKLDAMNDGQTHRLRSIIKDPGRPSFAPQRRPSSPPGCQNFANNGHSNRTKPHSNSHNTFYTSQDARGQPSIKRPSYEGERASPSLGKYATTMPNGQAASPRPSVVPQKVQPPNLGRHAKMMSNGQAGPQRPPVIPQNVHTPVAQAAKISKHMRKHVAPSARPPLATPQTWQPIICNTPSSANAYRRPALAEYAKFFARCETLFGTHNHAKGPSGNSKLALMDSKWAPANTEESLLEVATPLPFATPKIDEQNIANGSLNSSQSATSELKYATTSSSKGPPRGRADPVPVAVNQLDIEIEALTEKVSAITVHDKKMEDAPLLNFSEDNDESSSPSSSDFSSQMEELKGLAWDPAPTSTANPHTSQDLDKLMEALGMVVGMCDQMAINDQVDQTRKEAVAEAAHFLCAAMEARNEDDLAAQEDDFASQMLDGALIDEQAIAPTTTTFTPTNTMDTFQLMFAGISQLQDVVQSQMNLNTEKRAEQKTEGPTFANSKWAEDVKPSSAPKVPLQEISSVTLPPMGKSVQSRQTGNDAHAALAIRNRAVPDMVKVIPESVAEAPVPLAVRPKASTSETNRIANKRTGLSLADSKWA